MPNGHVKPTDNAGETPSVPTLALRGGLSGLFVDFDLLPDLFAGLDKSSERTAAVARWSAFLEASGFDSRAIDPHEFPVPQPAATLAADGAWRLAERLGFIASGTLTDLGREVSAFAELDSASRRESLAPVLAQGVESALLGQGGLPIVPLLRRAAECLAATTNLWARECPGLVPVEVGAIVYWACVDAQRAHILVRDIEINRDVAMHRVGPPDPDAPAGANPGLGQRVPLSFGEELALARLLAYCGLLSETRVGPGLLLVTCPRSTSGVR